MKGFSRIQLIEAALCVAALALSGGCTGGGPEPSSRTIRIFDILNVDVRDVPMMLAADDLTAQGYHIEKTYLASSAFIADALVRGDADIGLANNQTMWKAAVQGAPIRTIAEFTASTSAIGGRKEIGNCADLDGRRLGVASTRGLSASLINLYFKRSCAGAEPQQIVIPESSGRAAALLAGEIDATLAPGEELLKIQLETPGEFHIIMSYAEQFPDIRVDSLHVRRPWAEQNRQAVKDFLRALLRAHRKVAAAPQFLHEEAARRLELDPGTAQAIGDSHLRMGIWDRNGGLTPENIRGTLDFLAEIAALPAGVQVTDVADLSYLNEVLDEIGRQ